MPLRDQRRGSRGLGPKRIGDGVLYLLESAYRGRTLSLRGDRCGAACYFRWIGIGSGWNVPLNLSDWGPTSHEAPSACGHSVPNELWAPSGPVHSVPPERGC